MRHGGPSKTGQQAEPEEQEASNKECNSQLNGDTICIAGDEENEEATEQHAKTNADKSSKPILEGRLV